MPLERRDVDDKFTVLPHKDIYTVMHIQLLTLITRQY